MSLRENFEVNSLNSVRLDGSAKSAAVAGTSAAIKILLYDYNLDVVLATGTDVPTDATSGYAKGCLFIDRDVSTGSTGIYENVGTNTSCNFDPIGSNTELTLTQGSIMIGAASGLTSELDGSGDAKILVGNGTTMVSVAVSGDATLANDGTLSLAAGSVDTTELASDAVTGAEIEDDAVSLEHLDDGISPAYVVKYAGEVTWSGSGATLAATVTGVLATDIVVASFHTLGTEGTILQGAYASAADTITFTLDAANTSNDAVISYVVYRAAA